MKPLSIDRFSAIFAWKNQYSYEFVIKSRNAIGDSPESVNIVIPALILPQSNYNPQWIHNIYHAKNHSYTLTWNPPQNLTSLVDYTVYWCQSKRAMHTECRVNIINFNFFKFIFG